MITCKNCNFDKNPDGAKECKYCGAELVRLCSCGFELKPHWKLCPKCKKPVTEEGAKEPRKCSCGEPLEDWMDECPACGKAVGKGAAAAKAQSAAGTRAESGTDEEEQKYSAKAIACFKRAKELGADDEGAIREYSKAIKFEPNYYDAYTGRGLHYHLKGDIDRAIADYTQAIRIDHANPHGYFLRGVSYNAKEKYRSAVTDLTRAIELGQEDANAHPGVLSWYFNARSNAYAGLENGEMALDDLEMAVKLDPNDINGYAERLKKAKGGCFITTAVCQSFSKPDDCYELTAFRDFRDNWLAKQPDGEAIIKRYYNTAPQIVSAINRRADKDAVYLGIWNEYLAECLRLIEAGELEDCKQLYVQMVESLENGFCAEGAK